MFDPVGSGGGRGKRSPPDRADGRVDRGGEAVVGALRRLFRGDGPIAVDVEWRDGEPVGFRRRAATRRAPEYQVLSVRERWEEESPWPFPSPEPIGGDRLRCWRVSARPVDEPGTAPAEFVLRMRAGPGVWELVRGPGRPARQGEGRS